VSQLPLPIGVFTSVDDGLGLRWEVLEKLRLPTIHLHAPKPDRRTRDAARVFRTRLDELKIEVTAVFGGFAGESYADIPTTQRTVGLVPKEHRFARLAEMKQVSDFASFLGCPVSALHLGFIPHRDTDPGPYQEIVAVTRDLCQHCTRNNQSLHLETGQESAADLVKFAQDVDCDNLFVNFDPANMILYGTGAPLSALRQLGPLVRSVHCKDALWSNRPGETWGREVPLGDGDVNMPGFLQTLREIGYSGPLTIEREIPHDPDRQLDEIGAAINLLSRLQKG
jgi:sugar phosphate isomerase/epimerase